VPSNDPPERTTETNRQGRDGQTSCTSVHKANLGSQLSSFDTGSPARARPRPNDPPERVHAGALKRPARTTETKRQGRAGQTSCTSVHKANLGSQLSIFDTGSSARARPRPNDPPERVHPGALKRPARTSSPGRPQTTRPNEFTRAPSNDPPERPTRTSSHGRPQTTRPNDPPERRRSPPNEFTRAPSNDPPERPARTSSHGRPQTTRPNDFSWAPERPKRTDKGEPGKRAARTCTKPTSGHNLAFLIRPSPERPARTSSPGRPQTTRPNDPPERVHTGALKRPARTTRPNEFTRAPSNDPPERPA
jgi:hypothetical protein